MDDCLIVYVIAFILFLISIIFITMTINLQNSLKENNSYLDILDMNWPILDISGSLISDCWIKCHLWTRCMIYILSDIDQDLTIFDVEYFFDNGGWIIFLLISKRNVTLDQSNMVKKVNISTNSEEIMQASGGCPLR